MLLSMTGYGRGTNSIQDKTITIEIRSLNSKFTDIRFKIPNNYKEKEAEMRKIITTRAERGKLDVSIDVKNDAISPDSVISTAESHVAAVVQNVVPEPTDEQPAAADDVIDVVPSPTERVCARNEYDALKQSLLQYHCARIGETNCFTRASSESSVPP